MPHPPAAALLRRPGSALLLVAVAFLLVQALAVPLHLPLGWDEAVYASQVGTRSPAAYFSAPRARGITWLAAPAVALSASITVLRGWMSLLSAAGLAVAYWPWRRLAGGPVTALAAAFLGGLWVVQFYADEVMPNLYVAYGATAATGWFLRATADRPPGPAAGRASALGPPAALAAGVAFTALMRPPDAGCLAAVLLLAAAAVPAWRRLVPVVAVAAGLLAGLAPWLVEAYQRFGGPLARLRAGSEVQGGVGWHIAVGMQLRALNGPLLCRPCTVAWTHPLLSVWWLATPLLAAAGVLLATRTGGHPDQGAVRRRALALAVLSAAGLALQYLFLLDYAAPRFLIPAYALLALPVAACGVAAVRAAPRRRRPAVAALLAAGLVLHLLSQQVVLSHRVADQVRSRAAVVHFADRLNALGLRPPCTLVGPEVVPVAFQAGCASEALEGNNTSLTLPQLLRRAATQPLAAAQRDAGPPSYARGWQRCSFRLSDGEQWYLFLPPHRFTDGCTGG